MDMIRVRREPPLLVVTLDRPERRNAQTPRMWRALADVGSNLGSEIGLVIVAGEGQSFSAGLDRAMMSPEGVDGEPSLLTLLKADEESLDQYIQEAQAGFSWLNSCSAITVAAVQGHAIGAGMQLALACDQIIATPDAVFAMRETSLGLVPDLGGTKPLVERVGYARALNICATGRFVTADEAHRIGLVDEVATDPMAAATPWLDVLAATPPGAVADLKDLIREAADRDRHEQRKAERAAQVRRFRALGRQ
jgi:enoyl-CoA hydratase/carnithine racemase